MSAFHALFWHGLCLVLQKLPKAVFTCEDADDVAAASAAADDVDVEGRGNGEMLEREEGEGLGRLSFSTGVTDQEVRDSGGERGGGGGGEERGERGRKGKIM